MTNLTAYVIAQLDTLLREVAHDLGKAIDAVVLLANLAHNTCNAFGVYKPFGFVGPRTGPTHA